MHSRQDARRLEIEAKKKKLLDLRKVRARDARRHARAYPNIRG